MKVVLALDLGQSCGWALSDQNGHITSGTETFRPNRHQSHGMAWLRFSRWLSTMHSLSGIDVVAIEEVRGHKGVDAAHSHGGFRALVESWATKAEVPYEFVPVGTWKKHLTDNGNAGKHLVQLAVVDRGFRPGDDNEADAIGVLIWALDEGFAEEEVA